MHMNSSGVAACGIKDIPKWYRTDDISQVSCGRCLRVLRSKSVGMAPTPGESVPIPDVDAGRGLPSTEDTQVAPEYRDEGKADVKPNVTVPNDTEAPMEAVTIRPARPAKYAKPWAGMSKEERVRVLKDKVEKIKNGRSGAKAVKAAVLSAARNHPELKEAVNKVANRKPKDPPLCKCGCGERTKGGKFKPGHDARYYAAMRKKESDATVSHRKALANVGSGSRS